MSEYVPGAQGKEGAEDLRVRVAFDGIERLHAGQQALPLAMLTDNGAQVRDKKRVLHLFVDGLLLEEHAHGGEGVGGRRVEDPRGKGARPQQDGGELVRRQVQGGMAGVGVDGDFRHGGARGVVVGVAAVAAGRKRDEGGRGDLRRRVHRGKGGRGRLRGAGGGDGRPACLCGVWGGCRVGGWVVWVVWGGWVRWPKVPRHTRGDGG